MMAVTTRLNPETRWLLVLVGSVTDFAEAKQKDNTRHAVA
jgi:hypothetical protein